MAVNEYFFDLVKHYPTERRFMIRKKLEKPIFEAFSQAFFGKK